MVIAVDTRFNEEYKNFIYKIFSRISKQFSQHSFLFIFDKYSNPSFIFSENIIPIIIKVAPIPLLSKVLTKRKVAYFLKKYKPDIFITPNGLYTKTSQCLIFNKGISVKYLKKAKLIVAPSEFTRNEIIAKYKIDETKINVAYPGIDETFIAIDFENREKIKQQYAEGYEYFLLSDTHTSEIDLLNFLSAFSIFKKRQKSNMKVLITSKIHAAFAEQLNLYKFKTDVKILDSLSKNELTKVTASAYALVCPAYSKSTVPIALQAMKCKVPVIIPNENEISEICGDAVLYFDPIKNELSEKMILIFKDEKLRKQLIDKGIEQVKKYTWEAIADNLWKSIKKATN